MCPDTQASFSCLYDLAAMAAVVVVVEVVDVSVMSLSSRSGRGRLVWSELWGTDRPALPPSDQRPRLLTCTVTDFPCIPGPSLASADTMTMWIPRLDGLTKQRVLPAAVVGFFALAQECSQEARFCLTRYNVESLAERPECIQLFLAGLLWVAMFPFHAFTGFLCRPVVCGKTLLLNARTANHSSALLLSCTWAVAPRNC
jgi:hypothetical protein